MNVWLTRAALRVRGLPPSARVVLLAHADACPPSGRVVALAEASVAAVAGMRTELGAGLARELASFTPAPPTLREKFAHWWRDDRW